MAIVIDVLLIEFRRSKVRIMVAQL